MSSLKVGLYYGFFNSSVIFDLGCLSPHGAQVLRGCVGVAAGECFTGRCGCCGCSAEFAGHWGSDCVWFDLLLAAVQRQLCGPDLYLVHVGFERFVAVPGAFLSPGAVPVGVLNERCSADWQALVALAFRENEIDNVVN